MQLFEEVRDDNTKIARVCNSVGQEISVLQGKTFLTKPVGSRMRWLPLAPNWPLIREVFLS